MAFVAFERGVRYETSEHGYVVGDQVKMADGGRWFHGRVIGFESFEGSGLCFVDGLLRVEGINWPFVNAVAPGVVRKL